MYRVVLMAQKLTRSGALGEMTYLSLTGDGDEARLVDVGDLCRHLVGLVGLGPPVKHLEEPTWGVNTETLYHRDDALLYVGLVGLSPPVKHLKVQHGELIDRDLIS